MLSFDEFEKRAKDAKLVTLDEQVLMDTETPVSVFQRFRTESYSFLLESVEGQERWARYSFIGFRALEMFRSRGEKIESKIGDGAWKEEEAKDPLNYLAGRLQFYRSELDPELPRLSSGMVGYLGYDVVRFIEDLPGKGQRVLDPWDAFMMLPQVILAFDNREHMLNLFYHVPVAESGRLRALYDEACLELNALKERLLRPLNNEIARALQVGPFTAMWAKESFLKAVEETQEYIRAGDCIQTVLSQRFEADFSGNPFEVYRAVRRLNPSPYLYYLHFDDHEVVGASPETMVQLEGNNLNLRPIAGTRPRGSNEKEDEALEKELLADPKECAEHIMLVDLGRNDLGRVSEAESVEVDQLMIVERYSHVMHIVSNVRALLKKGLSAIDVIRATLPAGTLSGAPKVRAMQIIDEFEPTRRGIYGGCVGYFDLSGNLDVAIAIRTAIFHHGKVYVQAGAGIVLDSTAENEYQECLNKAKALFHAIEMAHGTRGEHV
jgi:anthranilate synthase component I